MDLTESRSALGLRMPHHDGDQSGQHGGGGVLAQQQLGQGYTEDRLQGFDSVGQGDCHGCKGQVGGDMTNGMHGSWPEDPAKLLLGNGLQLHS